MNRLQIVLEQINELERQIVSLANMAGEMWEEDLRNRRLLEQ